MLRLLRIAKDRTGYITGCIEFMNYYQLLLDISVPIIVLVIRINVSFAEKDLEVRGALGHCSVWGA
jgi:hypothetical protein